jgi:hypothetical protein
MDRGALDLVADPELASGMLGAASDDASEARTEPRLGLGRGRHDQRASRVDGDQLKRLEPDCECTLADSIEQCLADPLPVLLISGCG